MQKNTKKPGRRDVEIETDYMARTISVHNRDLCNLAVAAPVLFEDPYSLVPVSPVQCILHWRAISFNLGLVEVS